MRNRREFLKEMAAGAAILGANSKFALAAVKTSTRAIGKSKVVIVRDDKLRTPGPGPDPARVAAMLDRAMQTYAGSRDAVDPWKRIVQPGQVVGLKVNTIAGKGLSTNIALVEAICVRLQQAGIRAGDIIVWDRTNRELQRAGYTLSTDPAKVRCFGTDSIGYEAAQLSFGQVNTQVSKILTQCDVVINVPILKHHGGAGVTMAMKNMYGVIKNPNEQHGGGCNPYVADLNAIPEIRNKLRFIVGDVMTSQYHGGPGFNPAYTWNYDGLMVGEDRVAIDYTGWQIIRRKRAEMGMPTLEEAGTPPLYIETAANQQHRLGTDDPARIALTETTMA
ncbi:MAG: DUF362 domain-containing protein [Acidobacteriaceae bacterium]